MLIDVLPRWEDVDNQEHEFVVENVLIFFHGSKFIKANINAVRDISRTNVGLSERIMSGFHSRFKTGIIAWSCTTDCLKLTCRSAAIAELSEKEKRSKST